MGKTMSKRYQSLTVHLAGSIANRTKKAFEKDKVFTYRKTNANENKTNEENNVPNTEGNRSNINEKRRDIPNPKRHNSYNYSHYRS